MPLDVDSLIKDTCNIVSTVVDCINFRYATWDKGGIIAPEGKPPDNITREIDEEIQNMYRFFIGTCFGFSVGIEGEEAKKHQHHSAKKKLIASIDPVDGTDLWARGFSNWCTALFYYMPNSHVVASFVGTPVEAIYHSKQTGAPSGLIYFASDKGAYKIDVFEGDKTTPNILIIPAKERNVSLKDAAICFYGQKVNTLLHYCRSKPILKMLDKYTKMKVQDAAINKEIERLEEEGNVAEASELEKKRTPVYLRIYNLAGNPMMVRLAEGRVHAVLDIHGQKLYDVVPGAYIAMKAGAFWGDLEGNEITDDYLRDKYLSKGPDERIKYILATSKNLYDELLGFLK